MNGLKEKEKAAFYAGWLKDGNEGGKKDWSACSVPSQAAALVALWLGAFLLPIPPRPLPRLPRVTPRVAACPREWQLVAVEGTCL